MAEPRYEEEHAVLSLTAGPEIVPAARRFVVDRLTGWHVAPDICDDAALVASELVTNALRHGPPPIVLDISLTGDRVRISVADSSPAAPKAAPATPWSEGGRGLALLQAVAAAWGSERETTGKRVWCELGPVN